MEISLIVAISILLPTLWRTRGALNDGAHSYEAQSVLAGIKEAAARSLGRRNVRRALAVASAMLAVVVLNVGPALAQAAAPAHEPGGEANLKLPDLSQVKFLGLDGHSLLLLGLIVCFFGLMFGLAIYTQLKKMPVHRAMLEISELIY